MDCTRRVVRVGDLFDVASGGGRPVVGERYASLTEARVGRLDPRGCVPAFSASAASGGGVRPSVGDLLLGTVRPLNRSHFVHEESYGPLVCSHGFLCLRARTGGGRLDARFARELLLSTAASVALDAVAPTGSAYPKVTADDVLGMSVSVPESVEEQARLGITAEALRTGLLDSEEAASTLRSRLRSMSSVESMEIEDLVTRGRLVVDAAIDRLLWRTES